MLAREREDRLDETEAQIRADAVACEDEFAGWDCRVVGRWRLLGVEKGKVGEQEVEQGGREGVLRGEAVFEGKTSSVSERCDFGD